MLNLSDKDLDRLSREAAEQFEAEQDPMGWQKMEQLLDKELGRPSPLPKFSVRGKPFLYVPALAVVIGSIYFILKPSKHTSNSTLNKNTSLSQSLSPAAAPPSPLKGTRAVVGKEPSSPASAAGLEPLSSPLQSSSSHSGAAQGTGAENLTGSVSQGLKTPPAISRNVSADHAKERTDSEPGPDPAEAIPGKNNRVKHPPKTGTYLNEAPAGPETAPAETRDRTSLSGIGSNKAGPAGNLSALRGPVGASGSNIFRSRGKAYKKSSIHQRQVTSAEREYAKVGVTSKQAADERAKQPSADQSLKAAIPSGVLMPIPDHADFRPANTLAARIPLQTSLAVSQGPAIKHPSLNIDRSLHIGLIYSPDFSEVRYNFENKVGYNWGITLGYQLTGRLSLNSGLIFTAKHYGAFGEDFHAPPDYWINRLHLDFVRGECTMTEIPLNLRYDFNRTGNTSFFVSSGLSSYLMRHEDYKFYYHDYNAGFAGIRDEDYDNRHNYLFSVLNLSAGFETSISRSFSLQLEPYMKIPLRGIGLGRVDLSSYGINAALRFSPVLKRSRH